MREKPKNKERLYHIIEAIDNILEFLLVLPNRNVLDIMVHWLAAKLVNTF